MRVLIVGAGVAGLATATALARCGAETVVLERADGFGEAGAGLQLAPNATRLLFELGLKDEVRAIGFTPEAMEIRAMETGGLLLRTPLGAAAEQRWGAPYLQVHRADLHGLLLTAARRAGADIVGASAVKAAGTRGALAWVEVGGHLMEADVVIGADGIHSTVRDALFGASPARFTGQIAWRGLVDASRLPQGLAAPNAAVWTGRRRHLVHYYLRGGTLVNVVGVVDAQGWTAEGSWAEPGSRAAFQADFSGWPGASEALIAAVEPCWRWAIHDRPPLPRWNVGRVALVGDAAHPMPPFLAQGAGMAIEDAVILARHLANTTAPEEALTAYARARQPRVTKVRTWSRRNGALFHAPYLARAAAFRIAQAAAPGTNLDWLYSPAALTGRLGDRDEGNR